MTYLISKLASSFWAFLLFVLLMSCSSDSTTPETDDISDFIGDWQISAFEMTEKANTNNQVDLFSVINNFNGSVQFSENGQYEFRFGMDTTIFQQELGKYSIDGENLLLTEDGSSENVVVTYSFSNNQRTLQLRDENSAFDFNGDSFDEPAIANITLSKSN